MGIDPFSNGHAPYRRTVLCAALLVLCGLPARRGDAGGQATGAQDSTRRVVQQTLSEDWYDEDEWHLQVRYIMSPSEAAEYKVLKTVAGKDDFISRFWARRDPTPETPRNEFREEFERRVEYANAHFTDPADAPHTGVDTERGRIYVLFGAPASIAKFPNGAHEVWRYADVPNVAANLALEFSIPPIDSCDGSYRVRSPMPVTSRARGGTSIEVYPGRLVTARIAMDFTRVSSVSHSLRTLKREPVMEGDAPFWDGAIGPAGRDPLSLHILDCRMFESGGMGFTHPLPPGSYVFSSAVTFLDRTVQRNSVRFSVR